MKNIERVAKQEIKGLKNIKVASNSITYFLVPFLIAVVVGYKNELEHSSTLLYLGLLISLIIIQLTFGAFLLFFDNNLAIESFFKDTWEKLLLMVMRK